jgi:hypothetical protein
MRTIRRLRSGTACFYFDPGHDLSRSIPTYLSTLLFSALISILRYSLRERRWGGSRSRCARQIGTSISIAPAPMVKGASWWAPAVVPCVTRFVSRVKSVILNRSTDAVYAIFHVGVSSSICLCASLVVYTSRPGSPPPVPHFQPVRVT